jgi:hypothetical protein
MLLRRAIDNVVASMGADLVVSTSTLESRSLIEAVKPPKSARFGVKGKLQCK